MTSEFEQESMNIIHLGTLETDLGQMVFFLSCWEDTTYGPISVIVRTYNYLNSLVVLKNSLNPTNYTPVQATLCIYIK